MLTNHQFNTRPNYTGLADDDYDRHDAVLGYLRHGLWWQGGSLAEDGDEFPKASLEMDPGDVLIVERALAERGLGIADLGGHWLVHSLAVCPNCWEEKPLDLPCSACAAAAPDGDPDVAATDEMCAICLRSVAGPPFPFCCSGRARLIKKIEGPGPFRACSKCHGQGCAACEGTGLDLGEVR